METPKIIYKILKTLEENMGNEEFSVYHISAEKLGVSYEKWEQLMIIMQDHGYIKGVVTSKLISDKFRHICEPVLPEITIEGIEYVNTNSTMVKIEKTLKLAGEVIGVIKP